MLLDGPHNRLVHLQDGDDEDGEAEVLILKVETTTEVDENGEEYEDEQYVSVESEDVLDAVFEIFKSENADAYDFVEE